MGYIKRVPTKQGQLMTSGLRPPSVLCMGTQAHAKCETQQGDKDLLEKKTHNLN